MTTAQFHLAFGVRDLEEARAFYVGPIGCKQGREYAVARAVRDGGLGLRQSCNAAQS